MFRDGIEPMWEDESNKQGGKFTLRVPRKGLANQLWEELLLAAIGETIPTGAPDAATAAKDLADVCGIKISVRVHDDSIQVWNRCCLPENEPRIARLREGIERLLHLSEAPASAPLVVEYSSHSNKYRAGAGGDGFSPEPSPGGPLSPDAAEEGFGGRMGGGMPGRGPPSLAPAVAALFAHAVPVVQGGTATAGTVLPPTAAGQAAGSAQSTSALLSAVAPGASVGGSSKSGAWGKSAGAPAPAPEQQRKGWAAAAAAAPRKAAPNDGWQTVGK
jgi:hypothetical protein